MTLKPARRLLRVQNVLEHLEKAKNLFIWNNISIFKFEQISTDNHAIYWAKEPNCIKLCCEH
jgi:hypothetical protein